MQVGEVECRILVRASLALIFSRERGKLGRMRGEYVRSNFPWIVAKQLANKPRVRLQRYGNSFTAVYRLMRRQPITRRTRGRCVSLANAELPLRCRTRGTHPPPPRRGGRR